MFHLFTHKDYIVKTLSILTLKYYMKDDAMDPANLSFNPFSPNRRGQKYSSPTQTYTSPFHFQYLFYEFIKKSNAVKKIIYLSTLSATIFVYTLGQET